MYRVACVSTPAAARSNARLPTHNQETNAPLNKLLSNADVNRVSPKTTLEPPPPSFQRQDTIPMYKATSYIGDNAVKSDTTKTTAAQSQTSWWFSPFSVGIVTFFIVLFVLVWFRPWFVTQKDDDAPAIQMPSLNWVTIVFLSFLSFSVVYFVPTFLWKK